MKDFFANKQNTPHLKLYTWLVGLFYAFIGLNVLMSVCWYQGNDTESVVLMCVLGIVMCMMVPVAIKDRRRDNRNIIAVIATGAVHLLITLVVLFLFRAYYLIIVYLVEWSVCGALIVFYFRKYKL